MNMEHEIFFRHVASKLNKNCEGANWNSGNFDVITVVQTNLLFI